jgi:cell division septation protein DedD
MARGSTSSGLSIGQLLTLTFGFLIASVLIFALGWWVGYDAAEQRITREEQIVRMPVQLPTREPEPSPAPRLALATATSARLAPPTPIPQVLPATATPFAIARAATPTRAGTVAPTRATGSGRWTVQVSATTDPLQAVMMARKLRAKGYDAYTVQGPIGGLMWYRVRVGRFADKAQAQAIERRLKKEEDMEAAFVSASDQ